MLGRTHDHLDEITEFIRPLDPDVIGLIEVDNGSYRSGKKSQTEKLAEELGHFHSYCSKYGTTSRWQRIPIYNKQGNAFLAKDTIRGEKFHYFERGMKKLVIELELEFVTFFLVHLALSYKARQEQILHLYISTSFSIARKSKSTISGCRTSSSRITCRSSSISRWRNNDFTRPRNTLNTRTSMQSLRFPFRVFSVFRGKACLHEERQG
jgi:hypothetical protein